MAADSLDPARRVAAPPEPAWNDLRVFLAVEAHGSLNAAARALRVSQPTIARRMRALESDDDAEHGEQGAREAKAHAVPERQQPVRARRQGQADRRE
jgi:hypothetical protein